MQEMINGDISKDWRPEYKEAVLIGIERIAEVEDLEDEVDAESQSV